jgi:hypothetical protein
MKANGKRSFFNYLYRFHYFGWNTQTRGIWKPTEVRIPVLSLKRAFIKVYKRDNRLFDKELIAKEQFSVHIDSMSMSNTKGDLIAAKRFLPGANGSLLEPGVYLELNPKAYPPGILSILVNKELPPLAANGPLLDYYLWPHQNSSDKK